MAGVGMTTLLGVMSGSGIVSADVAPQPDIEGEVAPTEAEVTMKERCIWYVSGVASAITLDGDGSVYDGGKYSLSTTLDDYVAWTSGNTTGGDAPADAHAACTFFGEKTGIEVVGEWSGTEFTADALLDDGPTPDSVNMGFVADETDPLTMVIGEGSCRDGAILGGLGWVVGPDIIANEATIGSILDLALADATERPEDAAESNDKCNAEVSVTASIPAGKTPLYAGKPYKFTGPTFTTEIIIDSVG